MYLFRKTAWKFLDFGDFNETEIVSAYGTQAWQIGTWYSVPGNIVLCRNGFHACAYITDARNYVYGHVLARVEGAGQRKSSGDKTAFRHMRIVQAWRWTYKDDSFVYHSYRRDLSSRQIQKILTAHLKDMEEILPPGKEKK
jgi:hypothetical protein